MEIEVNQAHLPLFEALASKTRIGMIELLQKQNLNIKEMSELLGVSSAMITKHITQLEEAGIVETVLVPGKRGMQKVCSLCLEEVNLIFRPSLGEPIKQPVEQYTVSIPIGQYSAYDIKPTCGLVSESNIIGMRDDPRYFAEPDHVHAQHLWFASGFVEYQIPNYLKGRKPVQSVRISLELCSEAPGYDEHWLSDISFYLNDRHVGTWTSPGDFGRTRGKLTPVWWEQGGTQYGLLKTLWIHRDGTYMDGVKLSDITVQDIQIQPTKELTFRIASLEDAQYAGGVSLFGKKFGNYEQDILVTISC